MPYLNAEVQGGTRLFLSSLTVISLLYLVLRVDCVIETIANVVNVEIYF